MTIRENPHRWPSRWPAYGRSGNDATTLSLLDFEEESAWDALKREAFFPVSEQPLRLPSGKILKSYRALVRTDTDRPLSVVSGGYRTVGVGPDGPELERVARI